ncbi:hypothetical protein [Paenibacillus sp. GCM10012306]|uniref:hypothetical protein n=1 Tax=Paenibacillus sp. GCM10012306 TaxID=3317342 RepID=UPI003608D6D3
MINCEVCHQKITRNDEYYIVTVDDSDLQEVVIKITTDIGGCEHCEGDERAYLVYKFNKELDPDEMDMVVSGELLSSYLSDHGVTDK